jgi:exodeoxyribonuclease VII small subunit
MKAKTFRDAYGVLQRHAQTLREQDEPNIDDLLAIVTESVAAYQVCQQRIAAVEQALEKALGAAAAPGAASSPSAESAPAVPAAPAARQAPAPASPQPPGWDPEDEGDIPF